MMNSEKSITVEIATEEQVNQEFIHAWHRAERDEISIPEEHLYFLDSKTFFSLLSSQRLKLLHTLRTRGVISIQALSKVLRRKYQNVYRDVQRLKKAGLIRQKDAQYVFVPWDTIRTEINLTEMQLSSAK
jgi:predicted transcriptional regulator